MTHTAKSIRRLLQLLALFVIAVALLAESGPSTVSGASTLTFVANGTVDFFNAELAGTFSIGQPFTVTYTFDPATPDGNASTNRGDYFDSMTNMIVNVGPYEASKVSDFSLDSISILDDVTGADQYRIDVAGLSGPDVGGFQLDSQNPILQLRDPSATAHSSDALPATPPNPADYVSAGTFLGLRFTDGDDFVSPVVEATVDSIILLQSVGGVTSFSGGSGSSSGSIALLTGGVAAVVAIATAGGWYARRRWLADRS